MAHKHRSSWWPPKHWRPSWPLTRQVLWVSGLGSALVYSIWLAIGTDNFTGYIPLALVLLFTLIRIGYRYEWTGFGETYHPKSEKNEIQPRKTLWDWMSLLLVPSMLALLGFGLTWYLNNSEQARQAEQAARAEVIRSQFQTLQAYLDQMSALQIDTELRYAEGDSTVRLIANARTLAALRAVGPENKRTILLFLYDTRLIDQKDAIISLVEADLSEADLSGADLSEADLSGADLSYSNLSGTDLSYSNLSGADLSGADLSEANLSYVDLRGAVLRGANLNGAIGGTKEQLKQQAESVEGATMPDGSKHP